MNRLRYVILLASILLFAGSSACFMGSIGPEPGSPEAVAAQPKGLPGHAEDIWTDAAGRSTRPTPLTSETYIVLAKSVNPAVVNIFTKTRVKTRFGAPLGPFTMRTPNLDFSATALGTGFLISADGFLITNAHVVNMADEIKVFLWQTSEVKSASVIGLNRAADLALLKIQHDQPLPYLPLADSDRVRVGEIVVAVGNPFGLQHSLTDGLISAKHRRLHKGTQARYEDFLQTSAQINPGNSGGPLLNLNGEVVGVNTAIVAGGQGIGFAVPSNLIKGVVPHLMRHGRVIPAYIGVGIDEITPDLARRLQLDEATGALVDIVEPGSPAAKGGLAKGDVVVAVNGKPVRDATALGRMIALLRVGEPATLTVVRNDRRTQIRVIPKVAASQ
ncbi:MAG: trypsin-like peptidase domain-containing protein [Candidatus Lernaella stagnicola]|nr:trypsin-like peptidase domain-containing protein [Candidatus Lernaella stagnicola]